MKQQTFTDCEYGQRKKKTRREEFLEAMDTIIPWAAGLDYDDSAILPENRMPGQRY